MKPPIANRKSKDIMRALMDPSQPDSVPWSSNELRAMLEHQMATPLAAEIERLAGSSDCSQQDAAELIASSNCHTFRDVLQKEPPATLLRMVKDFAKAAMLDPDGIPRDVGRVIYILAILRGQRHGAKSLTTLDKGSIEREVRRCLSFTWLPETVRAIIRAQLSTTLKDAQPDIPT
jgi:hypothetical protein